MVNQDVEDSSKEESGPISAIAGGNRSFFTLAAAIRRLSHVVGAGVSGRVGVDHSESCCGNFVKNFKTSSIENPGMLGPSKMLKK